ncbi:MAG: hypothetical protein L3K07_03290 [Thermoplasmata archaeon]|nr:hypothetical protein [Thermoplasmata archaeon]
MLSVQMAPFESTQAAVARTREHLVAAKLLADRKLFGQAYAHASLGLEELSVAGVQLLAESGIIDWENPPAWFEIRKADLARPGTHLLKFGIGLTIAVVYPRIAGRPHPDGPLTRTAILELVRERAAEVASALAVLRSPATLQIMRNGVARRNAAFYSTSKAGAFPPGEAEYRELLTIVEPVVRLYDREWPEESELAELRPLMVAFADLALGNPAQIRELLGLTPVSRGLTGPAGSG